MVGHAPNCTWVDCSLYLSANTELLLKIGGLAFLLIVTLMQYWCLINGGYFQNVLHRNIPYCIVLLS